MIAASSPVVNLPFITSVPILSVKRYSVRAPVILPFSRSTRIEVVPLPALIAAMPTELVNHLRTALLIKMLLALTSKGTMCVANLLNCTCTDMPVNDLIISARSFDSAVSKRSFSLRLI